MLIPLIPTATLGESLHGRAVLEFPTIYVFTDPSPPSENFVLEKAYLKQEGDEQKELEAGMKEVKPEVLRAMQNNGGDEPSSADVDSKKILDVLKQDLDTLYTRQ